MHKLQRYEEVWWTRKKRKQKCIHRVCTGKDGMANQGENIGNTLEGEQKGNAWTGRTEGQCTGRTEE